MLGKGRSKRETNSRRLSEIGMEEYKRGKGKRKGRKGKKREDREKERGKESERATEGRLSEFKK